jgi:predicted nucleotidyltransferase
MSDLKNILKSFKVQENLNPKIWKKSDNTIIMDSKVRARLLEIAHDFIEFIDIDFIITDIVMTGSLANYNWSKYSDVDIHILADFNQFDKNQRSLYEELFYLKKSLYNDKNDFKIFGYDVENYVEDESQQKEVKSVGVYSILNNEWISKPSRHSSSINYKQISSKVKQWMSIIDGVVENTKDEDLETSKTIIKKYNDKLRKYRECGLQNGGEYSEENLVFKVLRRNGYLDKIRKLSNKIVNQKLSIKESIRL